MHTGQREFFFTKQTSKTKFFVRVPTVLLPHNHLGRGQGFGLLN